MKKLIIALLLVWSLLLLGCPNRSDIEKAAKWGYESAERTRTVQSVTLELFRADLISLESKDRVFDACEPAFDVLEEWNNAVEREWNLINEGKQTKSGAIAILRILFESKILDVLNKIVNSVNVLPIDKADRIFNIFRGVVSGALKVMKTLSIPKTQLAVLRA